jgi:hypothetical protein
MEQRIPTTLHLPALTNCHPDRSEAKWRDLALDLLFAFETRKREHLTTEYHV